MQTPRLCFIALILLTAPALGQRTLSPARMEADLFQMSDELLTFHAGLNRYSPAEVIDEAFGAALFEVSEERTELQFYRTVARLVSKVNCGHTRTNPTRSIQSSAFDQRGLLPMEVMLTGERLFIVNSFDDSLPAGAEVLAIDGRTIADIRRVVFAMTSGDGFIETGKERGLERQFARYYALFVQEADEQGPFSLRLTGEDKELSVDGLASAAFELRRADRPGGELIELVLRPEDDLCVLSIDSFGDPPSGESFPVQLAAAFESVRASGLGNLALDLRGNGGGDDTYGALLVSYFAPEPFGYFDHIQVTGDYEGEGGIVDRDGMRLVTMHPGTGVQQPSEPGFRGATFVLIDGWTFSTAADVATVMHHNGLATFVGEETGGGYDGNTSGVTQRYTMSNSGISFSCPLWMYTTANVGHAFGGRGVPPDHAPLRTIEAALAGRDLELAFVLSQTAAK